VIYLDSAATTAIRRDVLEAMWPALTAEYGNPSSSHELGRTAAVMLEDARVAVAEVLGARASEVIFTSGGTESDNLAIKGLALANPRGRHIVISSVEHPAVVEACHYLERFHGFEVSLVGVDPTGLVSSEDAAAAVRRDTTLVSVMYANNEVGSIQPIAHIARIARESGALSHTDAVQAAGSLDIAVGPLEVDALSISGHKLGAPKGVGALWLRGGIPIEPLLHGGGQERGRRSGTQNVAGAVGLAKALTMAESARRESTLHQVAIRDGFIARVLSTIPAARLTGPAVLRLPSHASFTFGGTSGEAIVLELERQGILASSGSACAAGRDDPSPVLLAMGVRAEVAQTAVRFTFDATAGDEQFSDVAAALQAAVATLSH
jgi:cysteine desulfurase